MKTQVARHRVFLKIYLWFWFAMIFIVLSQLIYDRLTRSEPGREHIQRMTTRFIALEGRNAVDIYERDGMLALLTYVNRLRDMADIHIFIFDDKGFPLIEDQYPPDVDDLVVEIREKSTAETSVSRREMVAQRIKSSKEIPYIVAGMMPPPPFPGEPFTRSIFIRILIILLVSGGICYWLTLYFTTPLVKLSDAVRQFADGNLSVRIKPSMTGRKDEFSGLASTFDSMADRIQTLLQSQRNLIRDVSHELRSPLARLNVALDLGRKNCDPAQEKSFRRIAREADKLNELIEQIVALNHLESNISFISRTNVDLAALVRDIVDDADFEAKSLNRGVTIASLDQCSLIGNEELLRRAIGNVVRNAVLYTVENSIVEVYLRQEDNKITVTVHDHGNGVDDSELENIFKPFYRVGEDRDRQSGGAGIGLAITDTAVRFHGGTVKASNAPGGGFIVEMIFPSA